MFVDLMKTIVHFSIALEKECKEILLPARTVDLTNTILHFFVAFKKEYKEKLVPTLIVSLSKTWRAFDFLTVNGDQS